MNLPPYGRKVRAQQVVVRPDEWNACHDLEKQRSRKGREESIEQARRERWEAITIGELHLLSESSLLVAASRFCLPLAANALEPAVPDLTEYRHAASLSGCIKCVALP